MRSVAFIAGAAVVILPCLAPAVVGPTVAYGVCEIDCPGTTTNGTGQGTTTVGSGVGTTTVGSGVGTTTVGSGVGTTTVGSGVGTTTVSSCEKRDCPGTGQGTSVGSGVGSGEGTATCNLSNCQPPAQGGSGGSGWRDIPKRKIPKTSGSFQTVDIHDQTTGPPPSPQQPTPVVTPQQPSFEPAPVVTEPPPVPPPVETPTPPVPPPPPPVYTVGFTTSVDQGTQAVTVILLFLMAGGWFYGNRIASQWTLGKKAHGPVST